MYSTTQAINDLILFQRGTNYIILTHKYANPKSRKYYKIVKDGQTYEIYSLSKSGAEKLIRYWNWPLHDDPRCTGYDTGGTLVHKTKALNWPVPDSQSIREMIFNKFRNSQGFK